jgi:replicative DNA helicase
VGETNVPLFSIDASYQLRPMLAAKVFRSGRKQTFVLTTRSGRTVKASGNHPFLTVCGWQRLDTLQEEDRIALPRGLTNVSSFSSLSQTELILLAHLLGDGCVLPRQPIHYTSADPENLDVVEQSARALFNIIPRRIKQKNWWHTYLPSPYRLARGKRHPISIWFSHLGIEMVRSYEKRIPNAVFQSADADIALFLRHLWATDGNISWKKLPGRKPAAAIYYGTTSKRFAEGVQHLLLRLSIWSTLRVVRQGKYRPMYQVHVQSTPVQLSFLEQIGCHGTRGRIIPELKKALHAIAPIPNTDTLPKETWDLFVKPAKEAAQTSWRNIADTLDNSYNGSALFTSGISRTRLSTLAKTLSSETLQHLAESDVYWDEVVSVTPLDVEEVYDITVPGTHNFVANDILVHNSIEQDADVVMFIHRDDKINEFSDRPNIAEIMIEKHRNGPTGKIELYFNKEKATFQSMEKSGFEDIGTGVIEVEEDF